MDGGDQREVEDEQEGEGSSDGIGGGVTGRDWEKQRAREDWAAAARVSTAVRKNERLGFARRHHRTARGIGVKSESVEGLGVKMMTWTR